MPADPPLGRPRGGRSIRSYSPEPLPGRVVGISFVATSNDLSGIMADRFEGGSQRDNNAALD